MPHLATHLVTLHILLLDAEAWRKSPEIRGFFTPSSSNQQRLSMGFLRRKSLGSSSRSPHYSAVSTAKDNDRIVAELIRFHAQLVHLRFAQKQVMLRFESSIPESLVFPDVLA